MLPPPVCTAVGVVVEVDKGENGLAPGTADVAAAAASSAGGAGRGAMVPMVDSDRAAAVIPPSFELCFETAEALLFKSPKARELDEYFGDIAGAFTATRARGKSSGPCLSHLSHIHAPSLVWRLQA